MNVTHQPIRTPNPSVWNLEVTVKASQLATDPDFTPTEGTAYNLFPKWLKDSAYIRKWGEYTYIDNRDGPQKGDVTLVFCKNFTAAEAATPFRTYWRYGNHRWPPQLLALSFIKDNNFPRAINGTIKGQAGVILGPNYYVRRVLIPEINEGSRFLVEEFFSNTALPISSGLVPVPTEVMWDIPGARGSVPECLHPDIRIPHTQSATIGIVAGNVSDAAGVIAGQFFPETEMTELEPYVISQSNDFSSGYSSTRVTVYPPQTPEPLIS